MMMPSGPTERGAQPPRFVCDAMLGGLARWLRAAGYDAEFDVHQPDGELVRKVLRENKVLLTSDTGILERYAITEGIARCLFIPLGLSLTEQLAHVLRQFGLTLRPARCMECNGRLRRVALDDVAGRVPPKVQEHCEEFFLCDECRKVFWHGTHWDAITRRLAQALDIASGGGPAG